MVTALSCSASGTVAMTRAPTAVVMIMVRFRSQRSTRAPAGSMATHWPTPYMAVMIPARPAEPVI